jgi:hypothetical protein
MMMMIIIYRVICVRLIDEYQQKKPRHRINGLKMLKLLRLRVLLSLRQFQWMTYEMYYT